MINAVHTLVYADDADAARAFFRDVLGWPFVDVHEGWLIFKTGPSELGVHPSAGDQGGVTSQHHEITLMCEDLEGTIAELTERGAQFSGGIQQQAFGRFTMLTIPGAGEMMLYQPRHPVAHNL